MDEEIKDFINAALFKSILRRLSRVEAILRVNKIDLDYAFKCTECKHCNCNVCDCGYELNGKVDAWDCDQFEYWS